MRVDFHEKVRYWYLKVFAMQLFPKQEKNSEETEFVYFCKQSLLQIMLQAIQISVVDNCEKGNRVITKFVDERWHFVFCIFFPISLTLDLLELDFQWWKQYPNPH